MKKIEMLMQSEYMVNAQKAARFEITDSEIIRYPFESCKRALRVYYDPELLYCLEYFSDYFDDREPKIEEKYIETEDDALRLFFGTVKRDYPGLVLLDRLEELFPVSASRRKLESDRNYAYSLMDYAIWSPEETLSAAGLDPEGYPLEKPKAKK